MEGVTPAPCPPWEPPALREEGQRDRGVQLPAATLAGLQSIVLPRIAA